MTNPASRLFDDAVWRSAFDAYEKDCGGKLWEAPKQVQEDYKQKARGEMRHYLATQGMV